MISATIGEVALGAAGAVSLGLAMGAVTSSGSHFLWLAAFHLVVEAFLLFCREPAGPATSHDDEVDTLPTISSSANLKARRRRRGILHISDGTVAVLRSSALFWCLKTAGPVRLFMLEFVTQLVFSGPHSPFPRMPLGVVQAALLVAAVALIMWGSVLGCGEHAATERSTRLQFFSSFGAVAGYSLARAAEAWYSHWRNEPSNGAGEVPSPTSQSAGAVSTGISGAVLAIAGAWLSFTAGGGNARHPPKDVLSMKPSFIWVLGVPIAAFVLNLVQLAVQQYAFHKQTEGDVGRKVLQKRLSYFVGALATFGVAGLTAFGQSSGLGRTLVEAVILFAPAVPVLATLVLFNRSASGAPAIPANAPEFIFDPAVLFSTAGLDARGIAYSASVSSFLRQLTQGGAQQKLAMYLLLTIAMMLLEFFYGAHANSLGLITDSFHMMLDATSIAVGLFASHAASWKPDPRLQPYGYGRFEVMSGFINGVLLVFVALYVFSESVERMIDPPQVEGGYLLHVSVVGLGVNLIGVIFFHGAHGHSHSSGSCCHGHHADTEQGSSASSDHNLRGVYLHILADLVGSVSVIFSSIIISLTGWWIVDPICSLIISSLICIAAFPLLYDTGCILLLTAPRRLVAPGAAEKLLDHVQRATGVSQVGNAKLWVHSTGAQECICCTVHLSKKDSDDYYAVMTQVRSSLARHAADELGVKHVRLIADIS